MTSVTPSFPTWYYPASRTGLYDDIVARGYCSIPDDPVNNYYGPSTLYNARDIFEPWLRDLFDYQDSYAAIIIINDTGYTLTLDGTPYYDGGSLVSQPITPQGLVNTIPPGYTTDRGTYLGAGRFVQSDGGWFKGSGIAMTFKAQSAGSFSQKFGLFVAGSVNGGYGLDICADMSGVDPETRFNAKANKCNTRMGTSMTEHKGSVGLTAVIDSRFEAKYKQFGDAAPLVFVKVTG